ncbi:hypothetical protein [Filimonas effusa]|uniref:Uncharacterized protein n=1 Tax=Filimonas effusa TaxID=2508721 RepID=A0A4Q1D920_9BACT|nr:hypothetical protein [Filimonas effusa]RXK85811.1 hypothetical protein ESB13_03085 [Filimonas effusa]
MKTVSILILTSLMMQACKQEDKEAPRLARLKARVEMERKVEDVITQLEKDCDSTTLSIAKSRADSIRTARDKNKLRRRQR